MVYLSAGACLGRHGVHCVCMHLCTGVPRPCLLSENAGVPPGGWAGGEGHWQGVLGGHWEAGERGDLCWD